MSRITGKYEAVSKLSKSIRYTAASLLLAGSVLVVPAGAQEIAANSSVRYLGATPSLFTMPVQHGNAAVMALDHQGNLILVDTARGVVSREPVTGGSAATLISGISGISAIAVDVQGDVYLASLATNQVIELPVGGGSKVFATGLNHPSSLAVDSSSNVIIADTGNNRVLSVTPSGTAIQLTNTIVAPSAVFMDSSDNLYVGGRFSFTLIAANSQVYPLGQGWSQPSAILQTATRDLYVVDNGGTTLTKFTYATSQQQVLLSSANSVKPAAIAGDSAGDLYVFDQDSTQILKLDPSLNFGKVPVGAQSGAFTLTFGFQSQLTLGTLFSLTQGTADGQLAINGGTCQAGHTYQPGATCTVAIALTPKQAGAWNGNLTLTDNAGNDLLDTELFAQGVAPVQTLLPGLATTFYRDPYVYESELLPSSLAVDSADNVYIGDDGNRRVLQVAQSGTATVVLAGNEGNNGGLRNPLALALDGKGNLFIADQSYAFGIGTNLTAPVSGNLFVAVPYAQWGYGQQYVDNMTGLLAQPNGGFVFSDSTNNRVIAVDPDGYGVEILNSSMLIGSEKLAINYPINLAWEADGSLLLADFGNARVVRRTPDGVLSDVVAPGAAIAGAPLVQPMGLAVDPAGNIYISDAGNNRVVALSPQGHSWVVADDTTTVDGSVMTPLNEPQTLAMDSHGNLYIADMGNERVVKLTRSTEDLRFSQTNVGSQSMPLSVTVQNTGNSPLVLQSVNLTGSPDFSLLPATTCHAQTNLVVNNRCIVSLVYAPLADGNDLGQLNIVSNTRAGGAVSTAIPLYGTTHPLVDHLRLVNLPTAPAAGSPFSYTLRAEDPQGNPVVGYRGTVQISWNGALTQAAQYTFTGADAGVHIVTNTVLTTAGVNTLTIADVQDVALTVSGQVILSAGKATVLTVVSGGGQSAPLQQAFAQPVVVQVADAFGNLAAGVPVTFTSPASGAGATDSNRDSVPTAMTDGTGQASIQLLANNTPGSYAVAAGLQGVAPVSFHLTNTAIGFTMTATPNTTSFDANGQASTVLSIIPVPGFSGTITFSCTQTNGASCNFSNASVQVQSSSSSANAAASGSTIPVKVTINNATTTASARPVSPRQIAEGIAVCMLAGFFGMGRIRRYRHTLGMLTLCLLVLTSSFTLTGCVSNAILRPTGSVLEVSPILLTVVGQTTIAGLSQPFQQSVTIKVKPYVAPVSIVPTPSSGTNSGSSGTGNSGNAHEPCRLRGNADARCVKGE